MSRIIVGIIGILVLILMFPLVLTGIQNIQTDIITDTGLAMDRDTESGQLIVYSLPSDSYITYRGLGETYKEVHDAILGNELHDDEFMSVLQQPLGNTFWTKRGLLPFDTSEIPSNAVIDSASLVLWIWWMEIEDEFDICVVNGSNVTLPVSLATYGELLAPVIVGGSIHFDSYVEEVYLTAILNEVGKGWINKGGITKLGLRTSGDIASSEPTGDGENVDFVSNEWQYEAGYGIEFTPHLIIDYLYPTGTTGSITLSQPLRQDNTDSILSAVGDQGETLTVVSYAPLVGVLTLDGVTTSTKATVVYETDGLTRYTGLGAVVGIAPLLIWIGLLAGSGYLTFRGFTSRGEGVAGRQLH